ncbi:DUF4190 domain-containing protein [Agromyces badenianii]|uniref:DUF4190 domain-containing protein n=1 Tax=Agromyces badenianii TaxID=2080742 RepID=UPI00140543B5|nr:DUF4190 domain-containing protein [Agromyces badenianii]
MTDPNLPEQPAVPPTAPAAPAYGEPQAAAPAYGQPAYGQPAYGQAPATKTNTLAIVSLVASIAGVVIWGIGFIVGVICGHIALGQIKKTGEQGRGLAVAGLIVGYIGIVLSIIGVIIFIALFASLASSGSFDTTY